MTNITEIIDQAAEKHVKEAASGLTVLPTEQWKMFVDGYLEGFTAGASFATTDPEMMKAMLQPFAEWMNNKDLVPLVKGGWMHHYEPYEKFANNSEELISKYIQETIKPKEDEQQ